MNHRRQVLLGAGALGLTAVTGVAAWRQHRAAPETTPIRSAPGFERLGVRGGISAASVLSIGLEPSTADARTPLGPAALCQALFRAAGPGLKVAVFSDYFCPLCPRVGPLMAGIAAPLAITWHEWPVLGPRSDFAARIGLAAARYAPAGTVHDTLMALRPRPSQVGATAAAAALGIAPGPVVAGLEDPAIDDQLRRTDAVAWQLGLQGTPAFVVGRVVFSGLPSAALLRRLVRQERVRSSHMCGRSGAGDQVR
ncbi:MAG: DsbA family protein [Pseudomonadota bacterium]